MKYRNTKEDNYKKITLAIYLICIGKMVLFGHNTKLPLSIISVSFIFFLLYLIFKKYRVWRISNYTMSQIDKLSGEGFEEFLAIRFRGLGYKVKLTPLTGDYGADLVLKRRKERIVIQAKRWSNKVGVDAVQQVVGSMKYYRADRAMVVTNNYFTENAKILARCNSVELIDRAKLYNLIKGKNISDIFLEEMICPRCGEKLVLRNGKFGEFYGCTGFPKCNFTLNIDK